MKWLTELTPSEPSTIWCVSNVPPGQLPGPPAPAGLQTEIEAMAGGCVCANAGSAGATTAKAHAGRERRTSKFEPSRQSEGSVPLPPDRPN